MKGCERCNHTGLLPFVKKGRVIPNAFLDCSCHEEVDHYTPVRPEDFDFPMSYDYYRSLCQYHGWTDPGDDRPSDKKEDKEPPDTTVAVVYRYLVPTIRKEEVITFKEEG